MQWRGQPFCLVGKKGAWLFVRGMQGSRAKELSFSTTAGSATVMILTTTVRCNCFRSADNSFDFRTTTNSKLLLCYCMYWQSKVKVAVVLLTKRRRFLHDEDSSKVPS